MIRGGPVSANAADQMRMGFFEAVDPFGKPFGVKLVDPTVLVEVIHATITNRAR